MEIDGGTIEFLTDGDGVDRWQQFFQLCLEYAELSKQRAAEVNEEYEDGLSPSFANEMEK